jgi:hypothetical protein
MYLISKTFILIFLLYGVYLKYILCVYLKYILCFAKRFTTVHLNLQPIGAD